MSSINPETLRSGWEKPGLLQRIFPKKKRFNAVLEGCFHSDCSEHSMKITNLNISPETYLIDDGSRRYSLYRKPREFENVHESLNQKVGSLALCPGLVSGKENDMFPNALEWPMIIYLNDGRIFVDEKIIEDKERYDYCLDAITGNMIKMADIFNDKNLHKRYKREVKA